MESSNFYELQQQQLASFASLAAPQSTTGLPLIHQRNQSLLLNNDEYDHYMNEILPLSAQLTTKNHINFGDEHERCPNPCTNQINAVHLNQNLWHTTSNSFSSSAAKLGWNISPSSSSTNIDYVLDGVITSSSTSGLTITNLPTDFMTNYFHNGDICTPSSEPNLSFSCHDSSYVSESSSFNKDKAISLTKRVSSSSQNDAAPKKQRAASHSSCPLPKVVKEKIGDRIAALHRLVAPFGKTDAASVLTEVLGYIQFLHHQIQTLSMSCIKQSQSNRLRCFQRVSGKQKGKECSDAKQADLKSRGLSLVPISVAAYVSSSTSVGFD